MKSFENREWEIKDTEIESLGDLVVNVIDRLRNILSGETARKAVVSIGAGQLFRQLPKTLQQKKTKTILELLVSRMVLFN